MDLDSVGPVVKKAATTGCVGVVVLGEMGEWRALLDHERPAILERVMEAAGSLKVTVGTTAASTYAAVERAREAEPYGRRRGDGVAAAPGKAQPRRSDRILPAHRRRHRNTIGGAGLPASIGSHMSPQFVAELAEAIPSFQYLKLEDPPTPNKITNIRRITGDRLGIFGGLGGVMLLDELRRGGIGAMTGFAYRRRW